MIRKLIHSTLFWMLTALAGALAVIAMLFVSRQHARAAEYARLARGAHHVQAWQKAQATGSSVIKPPKTWAGERALVKKVQKADKAAKTKPPAPGHKGDWQPLVVVFAMTSSGHSAKDVHPRFTQRVEVINVTHHELTSVTFPVLKGAYAALKLRNNDTSTGESLKVDKEWRVTVPVAIKPISVTWVNVGYDLPSPGMLPWRFSWTTPYAIAGGVAVAFEKDQRYLTLAPSHEWTRTPQRDNAYWRGWNSPTNLSADRTLRWSVVPNPKVPYPKYAIAKLPPRP